eukprot:TRINITY_DN15902_c0_g1_i10.p1 TRINITY_DN15902_c0_g1~~TRINITY_DN15902_c0_g1_i10.p1  ORF type:complete len:112 (+),score=15.07 TRINITY_DN15902_c0_g1_i10:185-520(+)
MSCPKHRRSNFCRKSAQKYEFVVLLPPLHASDLRDSNVNSRNVIANDLCVKAGSLVDIGVAITNTAAYRVDQIGFFTFNSRSPFAKVQSLFRWLLACASCQLYITEVTPHL